MDPILQPVRWLPDWLRDWAIGLLKGRVERRKAPRRMVAHLTAYYWEGNGAAGHGVRDISASGAFLYADFKWGPGTVLTMTLQREGQAAGSSSQTSAVVQARVVRHTQCGVGVQFLYSDKREQKSLEDFLRSVPDAQPS